MDVTDVLQTTFQESMFQVIAHPLLLAVKYVFLTGFTKR